MKKDKIDDRKALEMMGRIEAFAETLNPRQRKDFEDLLTSIMLMEGPLGESPFDEDEDEDEEDDFFDPFAGPYYDGPLFKEGTPVWKLTLRIDLQHIKPAIWRKLEVPSNLYLEAFAEVIHIVMGWDGSHLHEFRKGLTAYATRAEMRQMPFGGDGFEPIEGRTLGEFFRKKGDSLTYEYDMGDGWVHRIVLQKDPEPVFGGDAREMTLLSGKNACPPEDFGGPYRYNDFIQALAAHDKKTLKEEFSEQLEWLGRDYDPTEFDLEDAQDFLDEFVEDQ